jgi:hypothetical protein
MMMGDHVGGYHYFTSDVWEQHGWDLTTSGLVPTPDPCGLGVPFDAGTLITQITDLSGYDCLAVMQTQAWDGNSHGDLLASPDYGQGVGETNEGDYVLAGRTEPFGAGRSDAYLLKVYTLGNMVWENNCGSRTVYREDYGTRAFGLADTGVAATGWRTDQDNGDPCQAAFLRTSPVGSLRRHLNYSDPYIEYGTSICQVADEGFLIFRAKDETTHKNDLLLIRRIPGTGWAWSQSIGGDGSDWGCSALEIEPGYYIIAGYTESSGSGSFDGWLLKMREADAAVAAARGRSSVFMAAPSPNPFRPMAALNFTPACAVQIELAVYDVSGRRIAVLAEGLVGPGEHAVIWYGKDDRGAEVSPGVYVGRLAAGDSVVSRKVVRLR